VEVDEGMDRTGELARLAGRKGGDTAAAARRRLGLAAGGRAPRLPGGEAARGLAAAIRATEAQVGRYGRLRGASGQAGRDLARLEQEVALNVQAFQRRLDALAQVFRARLPAGSQAAAHAAGVALILSESLQALSARFEAARARVHAQRAAAAPRPKPRRGADCRGEGTAAGAAAGAAGGGAGGDPAGGGGLTAQQQQALVEEGNSLFEELSGVGDRVREVERSMEVARLHQAFSANVRQQVEQLEAVYANSVRTMGHLERGNVQLRKAVERSKGSSNLVVALLVAAALGLLFLDRFMS